MLRIDYLAVGALPPLSFEVARGECLVIEGPSGVGKTRLLRAIADLDPAEGYVYLEGQERREVSAPQWRKLVRYVSATPAWWGATGREHMPPDAKLGGIMQAVGLDTALLDQPVAQLSTGERQRLGFVRALTDEPTVLLLDEPTSALDARTTGFVEDLIKFALKAGRIVVLVTHDMAQIERLAHARLLLAPTAIEAAA